jgi:hypothetical protein
LKYACQFSIFVNIQVKNSLSSSLSTSFFSIASILPDIVVSLKNQHFQKELFRQFVFFVTHIHIRRFDKRKVVSEIKYTQEENLSGGQLFGEKR